MMKKSSKWAVVTCLLSLSMLLRLTEAKAQVREDWGLQLEHLLDAHSEQQFGVIQPLSESALGPYGGQNNALSVVAAKGLKVSVVSNATNPLADQIAFWPNDEHPTHLFMAIETSRNTGGTNASLQVVDLAGDPDSNVRTVLTGLTSGDPIRRTPWGTILVGEEAGDGAMYEIFDPLHVGVGTPAMITNRATGANTDPTHVFKRKALGALAFEGLGILPDGTTYYGDERRPGLTTDGGAIYKYVPDSTVSYLGLPVTTGIAAVSPAGSPFAFGTIYGMRLGTNPGSTNPPVPDNNDNGQGTEIGKGVWALVTIAPDVAGNINLRAAQDSMHLTGYYRPEDMAVDDAAVAQGVRRVCWTNTGRMSNGGGSLVEEAATYGEVMCMVDEPKTGAVTNYRPFVTRFFAGGPEDNYFDNIDIQPGTGRVVVLEDGEVEVVTNHGTELRGNDVWMLLPDGADRDVQSDGAIRILSLTDTGAEPTGWAFDGSGQTAYVNIQHRTPNIGAVLKITGFK